MTGWRSRRLGPLGRTVGLVAAAAVAGNAAVGRDDLEWFGSLRPPRIQIPLKASFAVGALYYLCIGTVLHRSARSGDESTQRLATIVLAGNEIWNVAFFGRRSTRAGVLGIAAFAVPVCVLQARLTTDRTSAFVFAPYTAWVIAYDLPWTYQLWRLNGAPT